MKCKRVHIIIITSSSSSIKNQSEVQGYVRVRTLYQSEDPNPIRPTRWRKKNSRRQKELEQIRSTRYINSALNTSQFHSITRLSQNIINYDVVTVHRSAASVIRPAINLTAQMKKFTTASHYRVGRDKSLHRYTTTTLQNYTSAKLRHYTTIPLHRYTATPLHGNTTTPLHNNTTTPLHRSTTTPLHLFATTPLHHNTAEPLLRYTTTPLHRYTTTPLHYYTTTPLQHYTTTPLHHFNTTLLHRYTTTPLHHYTTSTLHHYTATLPVPGIFKVRRHSTNASASFLRWTFSVGFLVLVFSFIFCLSRAH